MQHNIWSNGLQNQKKKKNSEPGFDVVDSSSVNRFDKRSRVNHKIMATRVALWGKKSTYKNFYKNVFFSHV